jgi:hypothetical protein
MRIEGKSGMRKYLIELIVGILVAAGLLFAGHTAVKLVNEAVETMVETTRGTQAIITAH